MPGTAAVGRGVDVNFGALSVVKIFSPINLAKWNGCDVQWARAAPDPGRHEELITVLDSCYQCSRNCSHQGRLIDLLVGLPVWHRENRQRVETIAHQPRSERSSRAQFSPKGGA